MPVHPSDPDSSSTPGLSRRRFLAEAGAAAAFTAIAPELVRGSTQNSKIALGIIGCGGRGRWIADLFARHGGYEIVAVADYFPSRADELGAKHSVPSERRFDGLAGYRRLLEQKLDAVAIETPPYFHPAQAADAVAAGKHVYLAKPVAVDVPGCMTIEQSAARATTSRRCFLVDFQTRANELFVEAVGRVRGGAIGPLAFGEAIYHAEDPFPGTGPARTLGYAGKPPARVGAVARAVGRHHHGTEHPHAGCGQLGDGPATRAGVRYRRPQIP